MHTRNKIWIAAVLVCAALGATGAYLVLSPPAAPSVAARTPATATPPDPTLAACRPGESLITDPTRDESVLAALYGKDNLVSAMDGTRGVEHGAQGSPAFDTVPEGDEDWSDSFQTVAGRQKITLHGVAHWLLALESAQLATDAEAGKLPPHTVRLAMSHVASRETALLVLSPCQAGDKALWQPLGRLQAMGQFGSMGSGAGVAFILLGAEHPGVLLSGGGTWQGATVSNSTLFGWDGQRFASVLSFEDSYTEDGTGACGDDADASNNEAADRKPACRIVENNLDLKPKAAGTPPAATWSPLVIHSRFVDAKGAEHKQDFTLTYRKGKYQPVKGALPEVEM